MHLSVIVAEFYLVSYFAGLPRARFNPLIGSASVSAVPMAARVSPEGWCREDAANFLLMCAIEPNIAGIMGTAVSTGMFHGYIWNLIWRKSHVRSRREKPLKITETVLRDAHRH